MAAFVGDDYGDDDDYDGADGGVVAPLVSILDDEPEDDDGARLCYDDALQAADDAADAGEEGAIPGDVGFTTQHVKFLKGKLQVGDMDADTIRGLWEACSMQTEEFTQETNRSLAHARSLDAQLALWEAWFQQQHMSLLDGHGPDWMLALPPEAQRSILDYQQRWIDELAGPALAANVRQPDVDALRVAVANGAAIAAAALAAAIEEEEEAAAATATAAEEDQPP